MSNLPSGIEVSSICMVLRTLNNNKFSAKLKWHDSKQNLLYFVCCRFSESSCRCCRIISQSELNNLSLEYVSSVIFLKIPPEILLIRLYEHMFAGWRRVGQRPGAASLPLLCVCRICWSNFFAPDSGWGGRGLQLSCVALRRDVFLLFSLVSCGVCGRRTREMMLSTHVLRPTSPSPFKRLNRTGNKEDCWWSIPK